MCRSRSSRAGHIAFGRRIIGRYGFVPYRFPEWRLIRLNIWLETCLYRRFRPGLMLLRGPLLIYTLAIQFVIAVRVGS